MTSLFLKLIQPVPLRHPFEINRDLSDIKSGGLKYNLLMLIYTQLQKYQEIIFPKDGISKFLGELKGLHLKSIALSAKQEAIEEEIKSLLRNKGIPMVAIKGNEIAKDIYNDPNCRTSSDVDMLVKRSHTFKVHEILLNAGYRPHVSLPLGYCFNYHVHHAVYYHPGTDIPVEMHWRFGVPYFFNLSSEEIWDDVTFLDSGKAILSPEMTIIMLLIHHHSHSCRGPA